MSLSRALPAALVLLALGVAPSSAQVAGDNGQPPTNAAECKAKLKDVDAALKWENNRWAKLSGKKLALRGKLEKKSLALKADNAKMKVRMDEITAALAADPPPSEDDASKLQIESDLLGQDTAENKQKLTGLKYQIKDIDAELARLKKVHRSNVRNTVKYRKQVADYCKRF